MRVNAVAGGLSEGGVMRDGDALQCGHKAMESIACGCLAMSIAPPVKLGAGDMGGEGRVGGRLPDTPCSAVPRVCAPATHPHPNR